MLTGEYAAGTHAIKGRDAAWDIIALHHDYASSCLFRIESLGARTLGLFTLEIVHHSLPAFSSVSRPFHSSYIIIGFFSKKL